MVHDYTGSISQPIQDKFASVSNISTINSDRYMAIVEKIECHYGVLLLCSFLPIYFDIHLMPHILHHTT